MILHERNDQTRTFDGNKATPQIGDCFPSVFRKALLPNVLPIAILSVGRHFTGCATVSQCFGLPLGCSLHHSRGHSVSSPLTSRDASDLRTSVYGDTASLGSPALTGNLENMSRNVAAF